MIPAHQHLVQWGLDKGYTIEVVCEGETDYFGTDYDEAIEAIEATEYGCIHLVDSSTKNEPINYQAWFSYLFGFKHRLSDNPNHNETWLNPDEIVNDYGVNEITEQWSKDYEEFFENCQIKYVYQPSNN